LRDVWILDGLQFLVTLAANAVLYDRRILWFYGVILVLTPMAVVVGGGIRAAK
jgi:hypothetical protein